MTKEVSASDRKIGWLRAYPEPHFPHKTERSWKRLTLPLEGRAATARIRELLSYLYDKESVLRLRQKIRPEDTSPLKTNHPGSKYIHGREVISILAIHEFEIVDFIQAGDLIPLKNERGIFFKEYEIPDGPGELYSPEEQRAIIDKVPQPTFSKAPPPIPHRIRGGKKTISWSKPLAGSSPRDEKPIVTLKPQGRRKHKTAAANQKKADLLESNTERACKRASDLCVQAKEEGRKIKKDDFVNDLSSLGLKGQALDKAWKIVVKKKLNHRGRPPEE